MPLFKGEFNDRGVGHQEKVSGWVDECPFAVGEECKWLSQIRVESRQALVVPIWFTKPLQVALRWQTLSYERSSQWYAWLA